MGGLLLPPVLSRDDQGCEGYLFLWVEPTILLARLSEDMKTSALDAGCNHVSNEKKPPGCFFGNLLGYEILPSYVGIIP